MLHEALSTASVKWVDLVVRFLRRVKLTLGTAGFRIEIREETAPIDERIAKIEEARKALEHGLEAVEELQIEAKKNREEVERALEELVLLENEKVDIKKEITADRSVIGADVESFRRIAGIPTERQRSRDKVAGFVSGVFASILAAVLLALSAIVVEKAKSLKTGDSAPDPLQQISKPMPSETEGEGAGAGTESEGAVRESTEAVESQTQPGPAEGEAPTGE